ncbi:hypothetical protein F5Y04DRAFT_246225 [Hypomontagnella monticulosa]|nr:hypothetical protein F5Y04DRAFT_246225 [Hypomontagnella monticulosa]
MFTCLFTCPLTCLFTCLVTCPLACLFTCPLACPLTCLPNYLISYLIGCWTELLALRIAFQTGDSTAKLLNWLAITKINSFIFFKSPHKIPPA